MTTLLLLIAIFLLAQIADLVLELKDHPENPEALLYKPYLFVKRQLSAFKAFFTEGPLDEEAHSSL